MAGTKNSSPSAFPIGNCKVEVEGNGVACESRSRSLHISATNGAKIKISSDDPNVYVKCRAGSYFLSNIDRWDDDCRSSDVSPLLGEISFMLLDPKDIDSEKKSLLQQVLRLYMEELPKMNYAANTGKKFQFLERCISSGKYRSLILRSSHAEGHDEVIAAVSYQIIPTDTRHAEIPLVAVRSLHQRKGIGRVLYNNLRERLESVGIMSIVCWADEISEGFWLKQGFTSVGAVDKKGKVNKLPIKANIKKALSFPGGSILMVARAKNTRSLSKTSQVKSLLQNIKLQLTSSNACGPSELILCNTSVVDTQEAESGCLVNFQCHSSEKGVKRQIWEASLSSLKSKRVKGNQFVTGCMKSIQQLPVDNCSLQSSELKYMVPVLPDQSEEHRPDNTNGNPVFKHRIMFMNITDNDKRTSLTKIVEELGGSVTCDGSFCTHVITGKARRTLNFSLALCSGAWVVSPNWLKESFRRRMFLGESKFILEDEEYLLKYKIPLRDVVVKARANPHSLLQGYQICLSEHIHPSDNTLFTIIQSAGGNVIHKLDSMNDPSKTIFLACEDDMSEALTAAKKGVRTFTSEWLMDCVMKQQLELEVPQFIESL